MSFKYKKEFIIGLLVILLAYFTFSTIKWQFFSTDKNSSSVENEHLNAPNTEMAITKKVKRTRTIPTTKVVNEEEDIDNDINVEDIEIEDDGSIIYDGLTLTELTNKLNKSLNSYMKNTGYYFAKFTKDTGIDPYLAVSIVLLETGCKWKCSTLTVKCNNIGGLKGGKSCNGTSYSSYDSLEEGIEGYLNIIYNNYYLKGLTTPEEMGPKYAASSLWPEKVSRYMEEVKSK